VVHFGTPSEKPLACVRLSEYYNPRASPFLARSSPVSWKFTDGNGRPFAGIYLLYVSVRLSRTCDSEGRFYERYFLIRLANRILLRHF
jgi:hypothetical protein